METSGAQETVGDNPAIQKAFNHPAVYNVKVGVSVKLGHTTFRVHRMLRLGRGAVVEFNQKIDDPVEIYANNILIGYGEVVVTEGDRIGVKLIELVKGDAV